MQEPPIDFTYQIVSMWKQGVPYSHIIECFGLTDLEHLKQVIREAGQCWGCHS